MKIKINKTQFVFILNIILILLLLEVGQCIGKREPHQMKLLTPSNQASIMLEKVHFVVKIDHLKNMDTILEVTHNNLFNKEVRLDPNQHHLDKSYFHFLVKLDTGSNEIKLSLVDNKIWESFEKITINISYETDGIEATVIDIGTSPIIWYKTDQSISLLEIYEPHTYKFHTREQELACIKCHDFSIQETDSKNLSCFKCHKNQSHNKNLNPAKTQSINCMGCHKLTQSSKYRFKQISSEICISCHRKRGKLFNRKYLHGPIEYGECWTCHNPHEGEKNRLRKKVNRLCTSCHAGKHYGKIGVNNHPILSSVNDSLLGGRECKCTDCHDTHGSDVNKFNLLFDTKGPDEPCKICHPEYFR